ncbi:MAG: heparinase II/III family protein [Tissierellales bacterium]
MKLFTDFKCDGKIISNDEYIKQLKSEVEAKAKTMTKEEKKAFIDKADKALAEDIPVLLASVYKEFAINGNRSNYQDDYYKRRAMLLDLIYGEVCTLSGKYMEKIGDLVWLILEESTWIVPAHSKGLGALRYEYEDVNYIDLFSAATGALIALTYALLGDMIDIDARGVNEGTIKRRMEHELNNRIILAFENYSEEWWYNGLIPNHIINNWNPWIYSNILFIIGIVEKNMDRTCALFEKILDYTDVFLDTYKEDGGCNEGPSYWSAAGGTYFDLLYFLYKISEGKINKFSEPLIYNMGDYIRKMSISKGAYVNFADCPPVIENSDPYLIYRFGKYTNNRNLMAYAKTMDYYLENAHNFAMRNIYSFIEGANFDGLDEYIPLNDVVMEDTQVFIHRNDNYVFAIKGGHNRESHNHNDVGHFIYYHKNIPVVVDAGVDTYSAITFSSNRYALWYVNSSYHNVAQIGEHIQEYGAKFRARDVKYDGDKKTISMELREAYPEEANIVSYKRSVFMKEDQVLIEDDIELLEENEIYGNLLLYKEPKIEGHKIYTQDTVIEVENADSISFEEVSILNRHGLGEGQAQRGRMAEAWGQDQLYRVSAKVKAKKVTLKYSLKGRDK